MTIELSDAATQEATRRAAVLGLAVSEYVESLLLSADRDRKEPLTVEEWREMLNRSGARLQRDSRPWRELTHEGHRY